MHSSTSGIIASNDDTLLVVASLGSSSATAPFLVFFLLLVGVSFNGVNLTKQYMLSIGTRDLSQLLNSGR
jgi:hypothetical protein